MFGGASLAIASLCIGAGTAGGAAPSVPRFFDAPAGAPELSAVGTRLSWSAIDPAGAYVLRRTVPGERAQEALVTGTSAEPAPPAGARAAFQVKPALGGTWSSPVRVAYPAFSAAEALAEAGGRTPDLRQAGSEVSFYDPVHSAPALIASDDSLAWQGLDPTGLYVLRRGRTGARVEVALVEGTSAQPAATTGGPRASYRVKPVLGTSFSQSVTLAPGGGEEEAEAAAGAEPEHAAGTEVQPTAGAGGERGAAGAEAGPCSLYASTGGNDSAPGTKAAPLKTVKVLVGRLHAGRTGCLASGQTFIGSFTLHETESHGEPGSPVTITSTNPANPATISGRVVTETGADWLTFTHLHFRWREPAGLGLPQVTIGSQHTSWTYDDIENANTTICVNTVANRAYGVARYTLIDHDRIYNCGGPIPYASSTSNGYTAHAVYAMGTHNSVTNNYIFHSSGRGVQLRGSHHTLVSHNVIDENGAGVVFGNLGSNYDEVTNNIITGSTRAINACCNVFGVYSWWGSGLVGTHNTLAHNCLYGNQGGDISLSEGGFTATANVIANPLYTAPALRNYTLQPSSPCLGDGPDTAPP